MLLYLLYSIIITLVLVYFLYKVGIHERHMIFAGFAIFSLLAGTFSGLAQHREGLIIYNALGVYLGDEVYNYAINHFGNPHSFQAHYTIPWIFRIPQIYLFASLIAYGVIGLVIQLIYNAVKKTAACLRLRTALITITAFIVCVGISTGAIYATQSEEERHGSSSPIANPVFNVETNTSETSEWAVMDEWNLKELSVKPWVDDNPSAGEAVFDTDTTILVIAVIESISPERGLAELNLKVDGNTLSSQRVALLPQQNASAEFVLYIPREGVYVVSIGNFSQNTKIINVTAPVSE